MSARLQDVVPEHPTADAIVNEPVFARPFSINREYIDFKSSSCTYRITIFCEKPFLAKPSAE